MKLDIKEKIEIPKDVQIKLEENTIKIKGPKGDISREFLNPKIKISIQENQILKTKTISSRQKKQCNECHKKMNVKQISE